MIAEGYDDCEGDLMERARAILGPDRVLGCEIDLHFNRTEKMLAAADLMVAFKEYPDNADRACEVFDLATRTAAGEIGPVMAAYDCRMLAMYHTTRPPMQGFVADMQAAETGNILSLSLWHGLH